MKIRYLGLQAIVSGVGELTTNDERDVPESIGRDLIRRNLAEEIKADGSEEKPRERKRSRAKED